MKAKRLSSITRNRHLSIIAEFDRLVTKERTENSIRAEYLPKQYYIHLIAKNPELALSENYISKILNQRYSYEQ